jgi:hypothetical protein
VAVMPWACIRQELGSYFVVSLDNLRFSSALPQNVGIVPPLSHDRFHPNPLNLLFNNHLVRFEVFTAVTMKNAIFWDVAPCRCCVSRRFGGTYCLHLQSSKIRKRGTNMRRWLHVRFFFFALRIEAIRSSETSLHPRRRHS